MTKQLFSLLLVFAVTYNSFASQNSYDLGNPDNHLSDNEVEVITNDDGEFVLIEWRAVSIYNYFNSVIEEKSSRKVEGHPEAKVYRKVIPQFNRICYKIEYTDRYNKMNSLTVVCMQTTN